MSQGRRGQRGNRFIFCRVPATFLTPDQIAEAQRMARDWMAKHQQ